MKRLVQLLAMLAILTRLCLAQDPDCDDLRVAKQKSYGPPSADRTSARLS